jgi:hypothetical protein
MDIKDDGPNFPPLVVDPVEVNGDTTDHERAEDRGTVAPDDKDVNLSQPLSPSPHPHTGGDAASGEELESDIADNERTTPGKKKWNNAQQARHWCLTKNNHTPEDEVKFKKSLENGYSKGIVITAIIAPEVGESGTPHLQGYIHFKKLMRQSTIHTFLGYDSPCMHLSVQGKEGPSQGKPPLAAFRYCMKDGNYYVVGKNPDELDRLKTKTKAGTGRCSDAYTRITRAIETREVTTMTEVRKMEAEVAARHDEYWKGLIIRNTPVPLVKDHPLRPWQVTLLKKLEESFNDREVIFVIDKVGNCGKSWFTDMYTERHGKCCNVGADKRENISYQLKDIVVEEGTPNVVFMDAPRARGAYVSSAFLEEIKNGKVVCPKYKSSIVPLSHRPHVVIMMNDYPIKNSNERGLSNDRYVYLVIDDAGLNGEWMHGYHDEGSTTTPDCNNPLTPYNVIQRTPQSSLPDGLQVGLNRAYKYYDDNPDPEQLQRNVTNAIVKWMDKRNTRRARLN